MNIPQEFEDVFRGVELTEDEIRTLTWITGWERRTAENLRSAIQKAQATALSTLQAENEKLRAELEQVDREGRCGVPPVKLHQKIFRVFNGKIYEEIVCGAIWEPLMPQPRWKVFVMGGGLPYFWHEVFGKSVFLAHAEAQAALRRKQDG